MDSKDLKKQLDETKAQLEALKAKRLAATQGAVETKSFKAVSASACAKWGVKTIDELLEVNTGAKRYAYIPQEQRAALKEFKEAVDITLMLTQRFGKKATDLSFYHAGLQPAMKAFGIDSGDQGFEWIPTMVSTSYIDEYNLERKVAGLFQEIKMPSNPYQYPVLSNGAIATKLAEASKKATPDTFTTSAITLSAVKISNQYELPEELQEDSAVDVMKVIRQELIEGQEKAMEIGILEGDADGTHQHTNTQIPGLSGSPAADSSERFFDGLRKRALNAASSALKVDAGAAQLNESHLSSARGKMGKFGVNPAELAIIVGPKGYNQMLQLDDVRTLEQYGPQAPVLSGELAKYEGMPVIVSEWLREDTDATGVNGAVALNNVKLSVLLVNRKRFYTGLRRAIQVRVENFRTQFDVWDMVSFSRRAFQGVLKSDSSNAATEASVVLIYNVAQ